MDTEEVFNKVKGCPDIEGITFLGGEPFAQASAVYEIALKAKQMGLTIVTFTGYTYEHIIETDKEEWNKLLSVTDLLVDGPFEEDKLDFSRPWVGSANQSYRFLTDAYRNLENSIDSIKNKLEIRINPDGSIIVNGMGDFESIKKHISCFGEGE